MRRFAPRWRTLGDTPALLRRAAGSRVAAAAFGFSACLLLLHLWAMRQPEGSAVHLALRMDRERSLPERFENAALVAAGALLLSAALLRRAAPVALAGAFLAYMAADNHLRLHEGVGATMLPGARQWGELVFATGIGLCAVAAAAAVLPRADDWTRGAVGAVAVGLLLFGAFAVGADALHALLGLPGSPLAAPLALMEEAGELGAIAFLLAVAAEVARSAPPHRTAALGAAVR